MHIPRCCYTVAILLTKPSTAYDNFFTSVRSASMLSKHSLVTVCGHSYHHRSRGDNIYAANFPWLLPPRPVIGPSFRGRACYATRKWMVLRMPGQKSLRRLHCKTIQRAKRQGWRQRHTRAGQDKEERRRCRMVEYRVSVQTHLTLPFLVPPFSPFCPPHPFSRVHQGGLLRFHTYIRV